MEKKRTVAENTGKMRIKDNMNSIPYITNADLKGSVTDLNDSLHHAHHLVNNSDDLMCPL